MRMVYAKSKSSVSCLFRTGTFLLAGLAFSCSMISELLLCARIGLNNNHLSETEFDICGEAHITLNDTGIEHIIASAFMFLPGDMRPNDIQIQFSMNGSSAQLAYMRKTDAYVYYSEDFSDSYYKMEGRCLHAESHQLYMIVPAVDVVDQSEEKTINEYGIQLVDSEPHIHCLFILGLWP